MSTSSTTSASASTSTTSSVDEGSDTSATTTSATTTGPDPTAEGTDTDGSSTGGSTRDCPLYETFEGADIDMTIWEWWEEPGVTVEQADGVLRMTLADSAEAMGGIRTYPGDVNGHAVGMTVATITNQDTTAEQSLIISGGGGWDVRLTLSNGAVLVTTWDGTYTVLYGEDHPVEPGWRFRVVFGGDNGQMRVELSAPGDPWSTIWDGDAPIDPSDVQLVGRALTYEPVADPGSAEFDTIWVCPAE
jgi:hypothetical protein